MKQKRSDVIASKSAYARRARAAAITAGNSRRRAPSCGVEDAAAGGPDGAGYYDDVDDLERGAAELVQAAARAIGRPVGGDAGGAGGGGDLGIVNCDTLGVLPADAELPALAAGVLREVAALRVRHATLALEEAELQVRGRGGGGAWQCACPFEHAGLMRVPRERRSGARTSRWSCTCASCGSRRRRTSRRCGRRYRS